jgi:hypothetical protein
MTKMKQYLLFGKKEAKNLSHSAAESPEADATGKSFLVLFFKKEHSSFTWLKPAPCQD